MTQTFWRALDNFCVITEFIKSCVEGVLAHGAHPLEQGTLLMEDFFEKLQAEPEARNFSYGLGKMCRYPCTPFLLQVTQSSGESQWRVAVSQYEREQTRGGTN